MSDYLFCHHQKTGGRSLNKEVINSGLYDVYVSAEALQNIDYINNAQNSVFISNHFPLSQRELFTKEFTIITMLREPSARLTSWWNHVLVGLNIADNGWWLPSDYHSDIVNETNITNILNNQRFSDSQINGMTRRLIQSYAINHSDYKEITLVPATSQEHLAAAKEVLDNSIVGIVEQYSDSVNLIASHMGITLSGLQISDETTDLLNPFIGAEQQVNDANNLDYGLWEYGKTLLASRLAQ